MFHSGIYKRRTIGHFGQGEKPLVRKGFWHGRVGPVSEGGLEPELALV